MLLMKNVCYLQSISCINYECGAVSTMSQGDPGYNRSQAPSFCVSDVTHSDKTV